MKLSEALRLGEFALPPEHGRWFAKDAFGQICAGCAVSRACLAAGYIDPPRFHYEWETLDHFMRNFWPWVNTYTAQVARPPSLRREQKFLASDMGWGNGVLLDISNRYECYGWSLSKIADWIETLEPNDPPAPVPVAGEEGVEVGR